MGQLDYIKEIAKYGLENDQDKLLSVVNDLIEYSKKTKKVNFAIQLQSILKDSIRQQSTNGLTKVGSDNYYDRMEDKEVSDLILEKITSDYRLDNIVAGNEVMSELIALKYCNDLIYLLPTNYYCMVIQVVAKRWLLM